MRAGVEGLRDILQAQPLTQSDTVIPVTNYFAFMVNL